MSEIHWVKSFREKVTSVPGGLSADIARELNRACEIIEGLGHYVFINPELEEICDAISEEEDLSNLPNLLALASRASGFSFGSIFVLKQGDNLPFLKRYCTSYPSAWVERYIEKSYQFIDPVALMATESDRSFRFHSANYSSPIAQEFWKHAYSHGIGADGVCFPVQLDCGAKIAVTFSSATTSHDQEAYRLYEIGDLDQISKAASITFKRLAHPFSPFNISILSIEELEFLKALILSDIANSRMSETYTISKMNKLNESIIEKLGVKNIFQASIIVVRSGFLNDVPISRHETQVFQY